MLTFITNDVLVIHRYTNIQYKYTQTVADPGGGFPGCHGTPLSDQIACSDLASGPGRGETG